jgi:peptidoglycan hydrolase-like protein with peptidoglycan-binding domain
MSSRSHAGRFPSIRLGAALAVVSLATAAAAMLAAPAQAEPAPAGTTATLANTVTAAELSGPCPWTGAHPEIRRGVVSPATRHAQCLLREIWHYNIEVDGDFGPATERAVVAHQRDCGIAADGIVGPITWRALHPDTASAACLD